MRRSKRSVNSSCQNNPPLSSTPLSSWPREKRKLWSAPAGINRPIALQLGQLVIGQRGRADAGLAERPFPTSPAAAVLAVTDDRKIGLGRRKIEADDLGLQARRDHRHISGRIGDGGEEARPTLPADLPLRGFARSRVQGISGLLCGFRPLVIRGCRRRIGRGLGRRSRDGRVFLSLGLVGRPVLGCRFRLLCGLARHDGLLSAYRWGRA